MARKTKEDTEQTRQAILDSALRTFYEKGFARTTFDEIAKRINLTKGAVYWHFRNKADLIAAVIKHKISERDEAFPEQNCQTIAELRKAILDRVSAIEKDADFRRFLFFIVYRMEWSEAVFEHVWSEIGELCELPNKKLHTALERIRNNGELNPKTDLEVLQKTLSCFWKGLMDEYILRHKTTMNLSAMVLSGFDMIINSVKTEKN